MNGVRNLNRLDAALTPPGDGGEQLVRDEHAESRKPPDPLRAQREHHTRPDGGADGAGEAAERPDHRRIRCANKHPHAV